MDPVTSMHVDTFDAEGKYARPCCQCARLGMVRERTEHGNEQVVCPHCGCKAPWIKLLYLKQTHTTRRKPHPLDASLDEVWARFDDRCVVCSRTKTNWPCSVWAANASTWCPMRTPNIAARSCPSAAAVTPLRPCCKKTPPSCAALFATPGLMTNFFLSAALAYLQMGYHPIPCAPKEKRPLVPWKDFQTTMPTSEQLTAWGQRWPDANVALVLGRGRFAVDLDGGPEAEALLAAEGIALPADAPRSRTGSGFHVFLSAPTPQPTGSGSSRRRGTSPRSTFAASASSWRRRRFTRTARPTRGSTRWSQISPWRQPPSPRLSATGPARPRRPLKNRRRPAIASGSPTRSAASVKGNAITCARGSPASF